MYGIIIHDIEKITQEATLKDQHGRTRLGGILTRLSPHVQMLERWAIFQRSSYQILKIQLHM